LSATHLHLWLDGGRGLFENIFVELPYFGSGVEGGDDDQAIPICRIRCDDSLFDLVSADRFRCSGRISSDGKETPSGVRNLRGLLEGSKMQH
jgi:hypothetical protein